MSRVKLRTTASALAMGASVWAGSAHAQATQDVSGALERLQQAVSDQAARLAKQEQLLVEQKSRIEKQNAEIAQLRSLTDMALATARGAGTAPPSGPPGSVAPAPILLAQATPVVGERPVGEPPPPDQTPKVVIASVPEFQGVLTPRGHFTLEPQVDYQHGSTNRLVFRGVEIVTGILIGGIEASDADRNTTSVALDARYGLTDRIELEARVPYLYRADRITTLTQRSDQATETNTLYGSGVGDVEVSARYQINSGQNGLPIFIAGLRYKSDTGSSPFTVDRDAAGVASELATGSGFQGLEGSLSFLYATDPAVLFGGISYLNQFSKDINKSVGGAFIGNVDPGSSLTGNAGFGFALNPRFSFSLGYKHTYIYPTYSVLNGQKMSSSSLQVGQFSIGWSFALSDRIVLTNTYSIGTTRDAPDMEIMFRLPIRF